MMRNLCLLFFALIGSVSAQNNARFLSTDGTLFRLYYNNSAVNKTPQAEVLIENIKQDTVLLKVEYENNVSYSVTVYLLEKGIATTHKEFDYTLSLDKNKIDLSFNGIYDVVPLPQPIVPEKVQADTSGKYKNGTLDHFCELKDGKPVFYNNLPKEGSCTSPMPEGYLNYVTILVHKAQTVEEKYTVVENTCRTNCINVAQLNTLLAHLDYELDRLRLVRIAYFNLTDAGNRKELEKSFRIEASVNELNNFFKNSADYNVRASNACVKASPEEEITKLAEQLAVFSNDPQRLDYIKKKGNGYCFSIKQVILILQKFLHDREKLEAAKLLYFNCVEKNNYTIVAEVFSYSQSSAALKDFIEKQIR